MKLLCKKIAFAVNILLTLIVAFLYGNGYAAQLPQFYERRGILACYGIVLFLIVLLTVLLEKRQPSRVLLFLNAMLQGFPLVLLASSRHYIELWEGAICSPTLCLLIHVAIVITSLCLCVCEPPFLIG